MIIDSCIVVAIMGEKDKFIRIAFDFWNSLLDLEIYGNNLWLHRHVACAGSKHRSFHDRAQRTKGTIC